MHDLQAITLPEQRPHPLIPGHNPAIQFHRDPIRLHPYCSTSLLRVRGPLTVRSSPFMTIFIEMIFASGQGFVQVRRAWPGAIELRGLQ